MSKIDRSLTLCDDARGVQEDFFAFASVYEQPGLDSCIKLLMNWVMKVPVRVIFLVLPAVILLGCVSIPKEPYLLS